VIGRCRCVDGATHLLVPSLYRGPIVSGTPLLVESLVRLGAEDAGEVLTLQRAAYVTEAQAHADLSSHRPATDSSTSPRTARRPDNDRQLGRVWEERAKRAGRRASRPVDVMRTGGQTLTSAAASRNRSRNAVRSKSVVWVTFTVSILEFSLGWNIRHGSGRSRPLKK